MRLFVLGFGVVAAGAAIVAHLRTPPPPPIEQPVAFNHAAHAGAGVECLDCHRHAATGLSATFPPLSFCLECHDDPDAESPEQARVAALAALPEPPAWVRVTSVPPGVVFSHRLHVTVAGLACDECHPGIGASERPPERPAIEPSMDRFCIACHERRGASVTCLACHR